MPICSNEIRVETDPDRDPKESIESDHSQTNLQDVR